ncbi:MAG TPA: biopolymer transporter ExbD [Anaeromyxobacteraceae bacterium]
MAMQLGGKKPLNDINVTPLIDVVLVLLIIFMVLTPLAEKQMFLRVPEWEPPDQIVPPSAIPPDQTVLTLLKSGRVLLNRQEMALEEATERLRPAYEGRLSKVLFFNAEDDASYELAVKTLDAAHKAGVNTIGMMTDPPIVQAVEGEAPPAPAP